MKSFIPVSEPLLNGNEKKYLNECIDTGWISSEGPFVERLESGLCELTGRKYGIAVCNGSAAIELAVEALEIQPGDEVIMPSFTIISCALAVVRAGAVLVYVDIDPLTWNMDVAQVAEKITEKTKAIMAVHIYGMTVNMDPLLELARLHNLKVIEDAAQAIGQTYRGKPCGSFGDISCLSFYPNKHITTGEGGMVLVNDEELNDKCRSLRNLCFGKNDRFVHDRLGWNFRMSNLQAAVGVAQLELIEKTIKRKREIGQRYLSLLQDSSVFQLPLEKTDYCKNIYWVFSLISNSETGTYWMNELRVKKIGTRPFFYPMHQQPILKQFNARSGVEHLPHTENIAKYGFYIPSGLKLTEEQIDLVASEILSFR